MLDEIRRLFAELHGGDKHSSHFDGDDYRVAAAALLVHVATLEHDLTGPARQKLRGLLTAQFSLTDALADELIEAAMAADREAVDFYHFTHLLMRTLDEQGRLRLVEMLWKMAFADGAISEFEDNVMWRVADLLAVSPQDRIALRQQVVGTKPNKGGT
ncbi:MAG TPA: TerB family tellurite resistance protein [Xanthobacteraceae bacterium]|nr:TerB family tellurite resistance protein [Xanthobacteraceae bacterium]